MHLVSLEVKGLKSLRDTKIEGLGHYNVFIGKNDSGKSTILQALRLLSPRVAPLDPRQARELVSDRQERGRIRASLVFDLSEAELTSIPGHDGWGERHVIGQIRRWRYDLEMRVGDDKWPHPKLYVTGCGPVRGDEYLQFFALGHPDRPNEHRKLAQAYMAQLLARSDQGLDASLGSLPRKWWFHGTTTPVDASNPPSGQEFYFDLLHQLVGGIRLLNPIRAVDEEMQVEERNVPQPSGEDMTQVLETWRSSDVARFRIILERLRTLFPDVKDLHLTREAVSTVLRVASARELEPRESFRLSNVGTGIQQALTVLTAVVAAEEGAMVLIEEPEINIHAGAQRALAGFLRDHALDNDKQILLTTHSTIFASDEEHCRTYLVRLDEKKGTKVVRIEAPHQPLVKEELGIRNVDLYGYNGVVLWEGDSEADAMPVLLDALAERWGTSVHALGLTSRNLRGNTNLKVQAVREFLGLLGTLDVVPYVVIDDDQGVREQLDKLVQDHLLPEGHYYVWQQGRKMYGRNPDVRCEFEDNFSGEQLVDAAMAVARDALASVELDAKEFARRCRSSTKKTSDELCKYYREVADHGLSKPELNGKLAEMVAPELTGETERTVKQYEFEKVARDIFLKLGGFDVEETSDVDGQEQL